MQNSFFKISSVLLSCVIMSATYATTQHKVHKNHRRKTSAVASTDHTNYLSNIFGGHYSTAYSGYDLFINASWINTDEFLLAIDKNNPQKNSLLLSGDFQAMLTNVIEPKPSTSNIALQDIEVQSYVTLDHWFHGFADTVVDPSQLNTQFPRAFITIGNLNQSDFYLTVGEKQLSFGDYSTSVINVLPEVSNELGGITADSVNLGWDATKYNINARAYVYKANVQLADRRNTEGGVDFVKTIANKNVSSTSGVSLVSDLADSGAISSALDNKTVLTRRIPAFDVRESISLPASNTIEIEYVSSFKDMAKENVTVNGKTVCPAALHVEWDKGLTWLGKPVELALGYNHTSGAAAFALPQSRFYGVATISPIRRTALSFEVNDDVNYSASDNITIGNQAIAAEDGRKHISAYVLAGIYF